MKYDLRTKILYQVFVRQYSKLHNIKGVAEDLERIRNLGVDILYLMPVQPIGEEGRKGTLGSPYSIRDYQAVDKEQGSMGDLMHLARKAHALGMKVILDMVFNHTSRDSYLVKTHEDWFMHDEHGKLTGKVPEWSDVTDFNFENPDTYVYLYDTLRLYAQIGLDGFRFDVASLVSYDFWEVCLPRLKSEYPNLIFIAESVHPSFRKGLLDKGYEIATEVDLFRLFDALYEYDSYPLLEKYARGEGRLNDYLAKINEQEGMLPKDYVKLRYLENHDFGRAGKMFPSETAFRNMLALLFFIRGTAFLYNGIETASDHLPSLFEYDEIDWSEYNKYGAADIIKTMSRIKKNDLFSSGAFHYEDNGEDIGYIHYESKEKSVHGIFNPKGKQGTFNVKTKDGIYLNLFGGKQLKVTDGRIELTNDPIIFEAE